MNLNKDIEQAVLRGDIGFLIKLKISDIDWNIKDKFGRTVIYDAITKGYSDIVEFLCKTNINLNNQDNTGKSPLHFASIHRQFKIAELLIENKVEINLRDNNGNNPLFDAIFNCQGNTDLVILLINSGANYLTVNSHGVSPKELAETISNFDITQLFSNNNG